MRPQLHVKAMHHKVRGHTHWQRSRLFAEERAKLLLQQEVFEPFIRGHGRRNLTYHLILLAVAINS